MLCARDLKGKNMMKINRATLTVLAFVIGLASVSNALSFQGEAYGMIASVGSGPKDQDLILSRRVDDTISFKYCSAVKKDGTTTPVAQFRKLLYLKENLELNPIEFQKYKRTLFENNDYCQIIGKPLYGINRSFFDMFNGGRYISPEVWDDTVLQWSIGGMVLGSGAALVELINSQGAFKESLESQNTTTFSKRLASTPKLRFHSVGTLLSLLVAAGSAYFFFDEDRAPEAIKSIDSVLEAIDTKKAKMYSGSMPQLKSNIEKAIAIGVHSKAMVEL
jgi:hypothetical protein